MGSAHERLDVLGVGVVENLDDGVNVLKAHTLLPRFLLRHVIHAEKLVIAKQYSVH